MVKCLVVLMVLIPTSGLLAQGDTRERTLDVQSESQATVRVLSMLANELLQLSQQVRQLEQQVDQLQRQQPPVQPVGQMQFVTPEVVALAKQHDAVLSARMYSDDGMWVAVATIRLPGRVWVSSGTRQTKEVRSKSLEEQSRGLLEQMRQGTRNLDRPNVPANTGYSIDSWDGFGDRPESMPPRKGDREFDGGPDFGNGSWAEQDEDGVWRRRGG